MESGREPIALGCHERLHGARQDLLERGHAASCRTAEREGALGQKTHESGVHVPCIERGGGAEQGGDAGAAGTGAEGEAFGGHVFCRMCLIQLLQTKLRSEGSADKLRSAPSNYHLFTKL